MVEQDMEPDFRSRLVALEHQGSNRETRLIELERWRSHRDIESARHDERWKNTDEKIDAVNVKIDRIAGYLEKIMWAIIVSFVGACVMFVIKGGLNL